MTRLKITIGPVELYARLLDTPAGDAMRAAVPFSCTAQVTRSSVYFTPPGANPIAPLMTPSRRAGEFVLARGNGACGIDFSNLPFVRATRKGRLRSGDVWARAMGDIGALRHVVDGDPVAVESVD